MLFPAAALYNPQGEKQKKESESEVKHHWTCIDNTSRKIVHLVKERERREHFGLPGGWRRQAGRQNADEEKAGPEPQADHRCDDLAARQRGGATAQRDKQATEQKNRQEGAPGGGGVQGRRFTGIMADNPQATYQRQPHDQVKNERGKKLGKDHLQIAYGSGH